MCSVFTGHAGNQNAAKLTRAQKEDCQAPGFVEARLSGCGGLG
ncbi:hypothetical protein HMPREF0682_2247 [Propionibacterium acidifaciens F0233]|uniref:Uncharacterized protein n=1 Tax=Propionibacterium acidifaciens F0233 TaxID=553198 RepID=U2SGE6_9ACTN|nr:hypothetical protein HMPREF0682_2247 [Propionibacterium acidifaciens F0233]